MARSGARACLTPPKHPDQGLAPSGSATRDEERTVTLRHPRYPDSSNILLVLSALDPIPRPGRPFTEDDPLLFGLHHDTARVACAIIANCCWHGYLSESKVDGTPPYSSRPQAVVTNKTNNPLHVLSGPHSEELAAVYHNIEPQLLLGLAVEYLFARFAWTVLAQTCFLEAGVPRRLVVRGKDGQPTAREVLGTDCRIMFTPSLSRSKSRSQSPKKRVRDDTAEDEDKYHRVTDYDDAVWDTRGRPRKRSAYQSATTSATSSLEYWRDASDCDIEAEYASQASKRMVE
ncbi:hypothetical protein ACQRIU_000360 [Beauveria bassiana]